MIYIYKDDKNRYIITETPREDLQVSLIFPWDSLPAENIRPWKCLGLGTDLYKPGILGYFEKWKDSKTTPPAEKQSYVYRKEVEEILAGYKKTLTLLHNLELIDEPGQLKYRKFMVYECDIKNYLEDVFGKYTMDLCEKYNGLGEEKKKVLKILARIQGRENRLDYLKDQEIDIDLFTFLPPWFKSSYQVFGQLDRIVRNQNIETIEYQEETRIDGFAGESLIGASIYNAFHVGDLLSAKEIKEKLLALFRHLGIKRTPKIGDLEPYFTVERTYSRLYKLGMKGK